MQDPMLEKKDVEMIPASFDDIEEGKSPNSNKVMITNLATRKSLQRSTSNRSTNSVSTPNTDLKSDEKGGSDHDEDETEALVSPGNPTKAQSSNSKALVSCINYSFCSVSMILVNKSLASSYNHLIDGDGLNVLLVVFQAVIAVICVEFCRTTGIIEQYPRLNWGMVKSWAPVNIFFCLMLFTGMAALQTNSVPMVTVFKNITNVTTTFGDYVWFGSQPEQLVLAAFGIMLGGAVIAAWKDITVTPIGLFWMVMNCVSTSGYVLYMKFATQSISLSKFGMVFVNNVLCVVFLLPIALVNGEASLFLRSSAIHTIDYASKNVFAGFVGFFLNFASLSCVQATGPTTYAIVGSLNKVPVTILGYFMFKTQISGEAWFYIGVSLCGGFLYSYAKILSSRESRSKGH